MTSNTQREWEDVFTQIYIAAENMPFKYQTVPAALLAIVRTIEDKAEERGAQREREKQEELLEALVDMYGQYCADQGHLFMSAGELASSVLEQYGYIFDEAGRMTGTPTQDKGDTPTSTE